MLLMLLHSQPNVVKSNVQINSEGILEYKLVFTEGPQVVRKHAFIHIPITDFSPQVTSEHPV